jgi:hypothetical protein
MLVIAYRYAVRPILVRHNIIPLQHLPSTISQHLQNRRRRGHVRLPSEEFDEDPREWEEGRLGRDLEDGFGVYRDQEEVRGEDELSREDNAPVGSATIAKNEMATEGQELL